MDRIPAVLYVAETGTRGRFRFVSPQIESLLGYTPEEWCSDPGLWAGRLHPADREEVLAREAAGRTDGDDYRMLHRDGHTIWVHDDATLEVGQDGVPYWSGILLDITEVRRAQQDRLRLAAIVDSSNDAIIASELDGTIVSWNAGAERLYGYTAEEAIGRRGAMLAPEDRPDEIPGILARIRSGERVEAYETIRRRRDGTLVDVSLTVSPLMDADGRIVGASAIARDIGERKHFESKLRFFADYDVLTGIFNRRRFLEAVGQQVDLSRRYGPGGAVLVVDLDNFKEINDTLGHAVGDEVLRTAAAALHRRLRSTDVLGRLGGDEFAVLLPYATRDQAEKVARDLVECLRSRPYFVGGHAVRLTASVGVALFERGGQELTAEALIDNADHAMYEAKEAGRDGSSVYAGDRPRSPRSETRFSWPERLRTALAEDEFTFHLQPIQDLATGATAHYEALLRLRAEDGGLIPPGAFLGAAQRSGLTRPLDRWVVRQAVAMVARRRRIDPGFRLEVNVSGPSLVDLELPTLIEATLRDEGVAPDALIFEVGETAAIESIAESSEFARRVREIGCGFALDDFGAGFGSFYYLKHLPVDFLKIDGDFIRNLPASRVDQVMVRGMVEVAEGLGVRTIAEFVGDEDTVELLREYGVDYVQGFHVGRPAPVEPALR